MNGVNGTTGPPGLWQEARNADGRAYYYNTQTKATQWTKPVELMSPAERALANQPWKEYTTEGGRKYWSNTETRQSSWEMPEVYKNALAQTQPPPRPAALAQQFVAGGTASFPAYPHQRERDDYGDRVGPEKQISYGGNDANGSRSQTFQPASNEPDYSTFEEAEAAFIKLLRRSNVQPDWTWEQTMRATIKDPQYRALKDPKDRKAAFEKYVVEVRAQEKERAKERLAKLRADFGTMLKSHPEIKHYTRWKTARPIIEGETIFRSTSDDNERRQLFEEYVVELKKTNTEREALTRKSAMDELMNILKGLDLEPYIRWSTAQEIIQSNPRFQEDDKFKTLSKSDMLTLFENHIKYLERSFNDERQREKTTKARRERQNRDHFIGLLQELKSAGKIKAGSKWMHIHPVIESDPRYIGLLGQSGSTPLDLFWDMVEEEERALRLVRNEVYDVLEDRRHEITPKTSLQEFLDLMSKDHRTNSIPWETLSLIFNRLMEKVLKRTEEDKHTSERHQRRAIDALRSKIKHLDNPPVQASSTWESIRPQIAHLEEFTALDSEDLRKQAFEKVVRRLKEKEEDAEKERAEKDRSSKRDHRDRGDRDRDRDRDRDLRNGHAPSRSSKHAPPGGRTPEPDAYEADRRKAMADRERQYRKSSTTGLSPPPSARGDRDRHERITSRGHGDGRLSHYDRDRREREDERERLFRARGDPRGSRDELDYGPSGGSGGGSGSRRRRGDSEGDSREGKRPRRDRDMGKSKTPEVAVPAKDEPAVHSGSEEGEMVEEE
ncbi:MAG: hypothetical protein MMC33_004300 [Icmadophila ericetorum]|nr:hypothetical protein [Icmadophila ericetorum]